MLVSKVQQKMDSFFLKELKKNTETTAQEQNISLSSKEIISPEPFAFKGFPTNTIRVQEILFLEILFLEAYILLLLSQRSRFCFTFQNRDSKYPASVSYSKSPTKSMMQGLP